MSFEGLPRLELLALPVKQASSRERKARGSFENKVKMYMSNVIMQVYEMDTDMFRDSMERFLEYRREALFNKRPEKISYLERYVNFDSILFLIQFCVHFIQFCSHFIQVL